ncbi:hypothetical protein ACLOJK_013813 [Asimina triloba]
MNIVRDIGRWAGRRAHRSSGTQDVGDAVTDPHLPPPTSAPPRVIHQSPSCRRRLHGPFFRRVSFGLFKAHQSGIKAVDRPPPLPEKPLPKLQPLPPPYPPGKIDPTKQILILDRDIIPVVLDGLDHPNSGSPESATSTVRRRRRSTVAPVVPQSTVATSSLRQQHSKRTVSATSSAQSVPRQRTVSATSAHSQRHVSEQ